MNALVMANGATVLGALIVPDGWIVLCLYYGDYVTWCVDGSGSAFWGHYFNEDYAAALADFIKRIGQVST